MSVLEIVSILALGADVGVGGLLDAIGDGWLALSIHNDILLLALSAVDPILGNSKAEWDVVLAFIVEVVQDITLFATETGSLVVVSKTVGDDKHADSAIEDVS